MKLNELVKAIESIPGVEIRWGLPLTRDGAVASHVAHLEIQVAESFHYEISVPLNYDGQWEKPDWDVVENSDILYLYGHCDNETSGPAHLCNLTVGVTIFQSVGQPPVTTFQEGEQWFIDHITNVAKAWS